MNEHNAALQLIDIARQLHAQGMLAGTNGNLSARLNNGVILITPSGFRKASLKVEDFALIDSNGEALRGKASTESRLHIEIYKSTPNAMFVVHAHPTATVAWTVARPLWTEIPLEALPEGILVFGSLPIVPYAQPGSLQLAKNLQAFLPDHRALILARHGAITWAENADQALSLMEHLEHIAATLRDAQLLEGLRKLPGDCQ